MNEQNLDKMSWHKMPLGGNIYETGNAKKFATGAWRSIKPLWIVEKCTQCMLCYPSCPDSSISTDGNGKRDSFDYDHCKGCGICANVCPFDAIKMVGEDEEERK